MNWSRPPRRITLLSHSDAEAAADGVGMRRLRRAQQRQLATMPRRQIGLVTAYGLAGILALRCGDESEAAFADLRDRWPDANYTCNDAAVTPIAARFDPSRWRADEPVRVLLIGTDFEVQVWRQTLLRIPVGKATIYQRVAETIRRRRQREAVGAAVGKNPISFVVPHRVVGSAGAPDRLSRGVCRASARILGWSNRKAGISARQSDTDPRQRPIGVDAINHRLAGAQFMRFKICSGVSFSMAMTIGAANCHAPRPRPAGLHPRRISAS